MNRRQRIIVSVTGIFIVLLVLLGLTYAYFLTRITGNSNPTSISVTTANLELVYGDGTTSILTSATPIEPGKFSSSKDFTVTNNGNALTDYAVTLKDFSITYANDTVIDGQPVSAGTVTKMEYPSDMKMEITCVIESDDEDRNGQACGNTNGTLPTENSILLTNSIEVDDVHKYVLTLTYVDSGIDQSKDMNKTIKGKIDIIDPKSTIDLEGTVATYQTGDYVEINSTPVMSEIVDGNYKLIGVEPGSHTLYVKYKDTEGNEQVRGSQTLTIKKGEEASVNGNTITFTDASRSATVDVTESYGITVDETVKSTLRDAILYNVKYSKFGSSLVDSPPSKVAEAVSLSEWKYGKLEPTYLYTVTYLPFYANSEEELMENMDCIGQEDCLAKPITSNCEDYKGKYVMLEGDFSGVYKVEDCINNRPIIMMIPPERVLSTTQDDLGTSYYFRGDVNDNFVNFAGMCWRIVRIEGDGSVKLILEDQYTTCDDTETEITSSVYTGNWQIGAGNYGREIKKMDSNSMNDIWLMNYLNPVNDAEKSMVKAFYDFQTTGKLKDYTSKLKSGNWCLGDTAYSSRSVDLINVSPLTNDEINAMYLENKSFYYDAFVRLYGNRNSYGYSPTLKCNGTVINNFLNVTSEGTTITTESPMYVGALTADEMVFAGGKDFSDNKNFYLVNDSFKNNKLDSGSFLSLSLKYYESRSDYSFILFHTGGMDYCGMFDGGAFRPVISLLSNTLIKDGEGSQSSPYVVD